MEAKSKCHLCKHFGGYNGDCFWCNRAPCDDYSNFEPSHIKCEEVRNDNIGNIHDNTEMVKYIL